MKKIWLAIAGVVIMASVLLMAGCGVGTPGAVDVNLNSQQQGLWVSGEGKVMVTPDLAIIYLGIEAQEISVADAQAKASAAMDKVIQALKAQGIADKDIQTQYFSIYQVTNWDNNKETITGYRVTNTVIVKVRDVTKAGAVIDAVVAAGGDMTRVNNIAFTVDDPAPYYEQARTLAVQKAKAKAQQIADEAGFDLGKITYITENSYNYQPLTRNYAMGDVYAAPEVGGSTSISAGELEVTTTIQLAYEIK